MQCAWICGNLKLRLFEAAGSLWSKVGKNEMTADLDEIRLKYKTTMIL